MKNNNNDESFEYDESVSSNLSFLEDQAPNTVAPTTPISPAPPIAPAFAAVASTTAG
jgi:hypothetical protein